MKSQITYTSSQGDLFEDEQLYALYFIQIQGVPNENMPSFTNIYSPVFSDSAFFLILATE
jgi:hypothetical protein